MKTESEQSAYIEPLHPDTWSAATPEQRLKSLQEIENHQAKESGRDACPVVPAPLPVDVFGVYRTIQINKKVLLNSASMYEAIETAIHEGRHAYQYMVIDNKIQHHDAKEARIWKINAEVYIQDAIDGSMSFYLFQPLEKDAERFANDKIKEIANYLERHYGPLDGYVKHITETKINNLKYEEKAIKYYGSDYEHHIKSRIENACKVSLTLSASKQEQRHTLDLPAPAFLDADLNLRESRELAARVKAQAYDLARESFGRDPAGVTVAAESAPPADAWERGRYHAKAAGAVKIAARAVGEVNQEIEFERARRAWSPDARAHGLRGVCGRTLCAERFAGMVVQGAESDLYFPHHDRSGLAGVSVNDGVSDCAGVWHSRVRASDQTLVLCERPIDCLSYHECECDAHTRYIATGERLNAVTRELIAAAVRHAPDRCRPGRRQDRRRSVRHPGARYQTPALHKKDG